METWRKVWRQGFLPSLSTRSLEALRVGLMIDDPRLLQSATTSPPPLHALQDWPVEGACVLGYSGWQGEGLETVAEVEDFFARSCFEADQRLGEPAACRCFLNAYDDWSRAEMIKNLLPEVEANLAERKAVCHAV